VDDSILIKIAITHPVTTAAGAILVLGNRTIFATNMIPFAFEIPGMTAGTGWRVP
jgi:hypothetical protein